jgi:hypothetical protein
VELRFKVWHEGSERVPLGESGVKVPRVWMFEQREAGADWPTLRMRVEVRDGIPLIREVQITSTPHGMEVQSAHLRQVPLEDLVEYVASVIVQEVTLWDDLPDGESTVSVEDVRRARLEGKAHARGQRRKRRRTVTDSMLQEVAAVYLAADRAPVRAVEEHFGKTRRTASWYVKQAREAGLLPESGDDENGEAEGRGE